VKSKLMTSSSTSFFLLWFLIICALKSFKLLCWRVWIRTAPICLQNRPWWQVHRNFVMAPSFAREISTRWVLVPLSLTRADIRPGFWLYFKMASFWENSRDWEYIFGPSNFWMSSRLFKFFKTIFPQVSPSENWRTAKNRRDVL